MYPWPCFNRYHHFVVLFNWHFKPNSRLTLFHMSVYQYASLTDKDIKNNITTKPLSHSGLLLICSRHQLPFFHFSPLLYRAAYTIPSHASSCCLSERRTSQYTQPPCASRVFYLQNNVYEEWRFLAFAFVQLISDILISRKCIQTVNSSTTILSLILSCYVKRIYLKKKKTTLSVLRDFKAV